MRILYIYLQGYKPLLLNNIDSIEIYFKENTMLILGTNGSGKSSLLKITTPFPPSSELFSENGKKIIELEHNGIIYRIDSTLSKAGKHTLTKNNSIVYENVTATQVREYVIKEFGYTPLVHKVLTGEIKFTEMTVQARRDILTEISPLDLNYAIKLHNTIKEKVRDNQAVIAHLVTQGSAAKTKLHNIAIDPNITEKKNDLEAKLNRLIPFTVTKLPSVSSLQQAIDDGYNQLMSINQTLDKFDTTRVPVEGINSVDDLNEFIGNCTGKISATQANINNLTKEIETLTGVTQSLTDSLLTTADIQQRLAIIHDELEQHNETCYVVEDHDKYLAKLTHICNEFNNVFSNTTDLLFYTKDEQNEIVVTNSRYKTQIASLSAQLTNLETQIQHFKTEGITTTCPRCQFEFNSKGTTHTDKLAEAEANHRKVTTELEAMLPLKAENDIKHEHYNKLLLAQNKIQDIKRNYFMPFSFWEQLKNSTEILQHPTTAINVVINWMRNIEQGIETSKLLAEQANYIKALDVYTRYGFNMDSKLTGLNELLATELMAKVTLEKQLSTARLVLKNIQTYEKLNQSAVDIFKRLNDNFKLVMEAMIQEDAKKTCDSIYNELATLKQSLNTHEHLTQVIAENALAHEAELTKRKSLLLLEEHLSHNKGVIADSMLSFLSSYLNEVNVICDMVWEYPLNLSMYPMDEEGILVYNFPLNVDNEIIADIKLGSTGQKELINLAFMIVMRQYLNLTEYPLYLDEIGSGFDDMHRKTLIMYIKSLLESKLCSQLLLINHYSQVIGSLSNHDVVVLDSRNIISPDNSNATTVITYL